MTSHVLVIDDRRTCPVCDQSYRSKIGHFCEFAATPDARWLGPRQFRAAESGARIVCDLRQSYAANCYVAPDGRYGVTLCLRPDVYLVVREAYEDESGSARDIILRETGIDLEQIRQRFKTSTVPFWARMTKLPTKKGPRT